MTTPHSSGELAPSRAAGITRPAARTRGRAAAFAVLAIGLTATACSGDDESSADTTVAVSTAAPAPSSTATSVATTVATTAAPTLDTADLPPIGTGDLPPIGTGDIPLPPVTADLPYPVSVTVGIDSNPDRIERVPLGATVTITVTNPGDDDEFHLHGFDLGDGQVIPAGQPASFTFVADQVGSFELESHETGDVLMILEVV